jgi:hypothetical protein
MKRRSFLGIAFLLAFFSCEGQLLNNNELLGNRYHYVWWTIGDSNSRGNSTAAGTTPVAGTVKQWDDTNGKVVNVGSSDMLEVIAAGTSGSQWPQAGRTFFELTGQVPIFVNTGIGGSAFYNPSAGFSWYTNDAVFTNSLTKVNNCLTYLNRNAPDAVWIELGINDVLQGHALSQTYLTSLIDRILTEFPGVRICISQPWAGSVALSTYANFTRLYQIRKWIKALCFAYPTVEIAGDMAVIVNFGSTMQGDDIHRDATGNGFWGDKTMYGICQSMALNKWTRSWTGTFYNRISSTRIGWINTLVNTLESGGDLEWIDSFQVTSTAGYTDATNKHKNAMQDLGFIANNQILAAVGQFSETGFNPSGLVDSDRIACTPLSLLADKADLTSDFITGFWMGSNAVGATTASAQHLVRESPAGGIAGIHQNGSSQIVAYATSGAGVADGTETRPANAFYGAVRDGGNVRLVKNSTVVASSAIAYNALNPGSSIRTFSIANYNNNGTIQQRWAGNFKAQMVANYTNINLADVVPAVDTFLADWLTNVP